MSLKSERVKNWRKSSKNRIIEAMGGCCQICSYNKCSSALDLHHIDPTKKDITISRIRANCSSWETTVKELRKCILLCANCHREVHANITKLPEHYTIYNEEFTDYKTKQEVDSCPICESIKLKSHKFCSNKCAQQYKRKVDWDSIDIQSLYKQLETKVAVAEYLGVSDKTVAKYLKRSTN